MNARGSWHSRVWGGAAARLPRANRPATENKKGTLTREAVYSGIYDLIVTTLCVLKPFNVSYVYFKTKEIVDSSL